MPPKEDGTKRPDVSGWKKHIDTGESTTPAQHDRWYDGGRRTGIGIITGAVSGDLELLEFEGRAVAEGVYDEVADIAFSSGLGELWDRVTSGWVEESPSGGIHLKYRVTGTPVPGNTKLAERLSTPEELDASRAQVRADAQVKGENLTDEQVERRTKKRQTLIETRGQGGYVIVAPSHGSVHESGKPYVRRCGGPATIPTVTAEELEALHIICEVVDKVPKQETKQSAPQDPRPPIEGMLRPGEDYENRTDWSEILEPEGWQVVYQRGRTRYWRRPGKRLGVSATTGRAEDRDRFYVFSSSTEFEQQIPYTKFGAHALLHYGGNHSEAARALARQGYGSRPPRRRLSLVGSHQAPPTDGSSALAPDPGPEYDPALDGSPDPAGPEKSADRPQIDITNEADAVDALLGVMADGGLGDLYKRSAGVCWVHQDDQGSPVVRQLATDNLRAYLAEHVITYTVVADPDTKGTKEVRALVMRQTCATLLGRKDWPLNPLRGIVTSPVVRPDGTLLKEPGYDRATGLYLHPRVKLRRLRPEVLPESVAKAKQIVLDQMLADFPWQAPSDKAQFLGALLTPIIRPYAPGPTPLFVITATSAGSGKTLLKDIIKHCFGIGDMPWPENEAELRKAISAQLYTGGEPVVAIDNLPNGLVIKSPILSGLLTADAWRDRVLGSTEVITMANDRLWIATGNNLRTGGDNARRTVWVRIDPDCPNPDQRDGFAVGDLRPWLHANASTIVAALVTMVRGWLAAGAVPVRTRMGDYSEWASVIAGILSYLDVPGWLADRDTTAVMDDEAEEWSAFLEAWSEKFGTRKVTTGSVLQVLADHVPRPYKDELPSSRELGHMLKARRGRFFGVHKVLMSKDSNKKQNVWHVEVHTDRQMGGDQQ